MLALSIDGLVQEIPISIANILELCLSFTKPSTYPWKYLANPPREGTHSSGCSHELKKGHLHSMSSTHTLSIHSITFRHIYWQSMVLRSWFELISVLCISPTVNDWISIILSNQFQFLMAIIMLLICHNVPEDVFVTNSWKQEYI